MLEDIKEWLSDNLRYLLLGLSVLLGVVIILFVVRLFRGRGNKEIVDNQTEAGTERSEGEGETEAGDGITLTSNDPEILDVMTRYYNAKADKDIETVRKINPAFSAEDEADLLQNDVYERYDNIIVYSREGLDSNSYIAYVYLDVKIAGIATPAPTLFDEYLRKNDEGDLVIVDKNSSQELISFIEKMRTSTVVQNMIKNVNRKLEEAAASDPDLKAYVEKRKNGQNSNTGSGDSGGVPADAPKENGAAKATTDVRVRSEASTNGEIYGMLTAGFEVTVLENLDSGWSKIRYTTNGVTIEGYVMTQYLEAE